MSIGPHIHPFMPSSSSSQVDVHLAKNCKNISPVDWKCRPRFWRWMWQASFGAERTDLNKKPVRNNWCWWHKLCNPNISPPIVASKNNVVNPIIKILRGCWCNLWYFYIMVYGIGLPHWSNFSKIENPAFLTFETTNQWIGLVGKIYTRNHQDFSIFPFFIGVYPPVN